jgi:hypothetical protein
MYAMTPGAEYTRIAEMPCAHSGLLAVALNWTGLVLFESFVGLVTVMVGVVAKTAMLQSSIEDDSAMERNFRLIVLRLIMLRLIMETSRDERRENVVLSQESSEILLRNAHRFSYARCLSGPTLAIGCAL